MCFMLSWTLIFLSSSVAITINPLETLQHLQVSFHLWRLATVSGRTPWLWIVWIQQISTVCVSSESSSFPLSCWIVSFFPLIGNKLNSFSNANFNCISRSVWLIAFWVVWRLSSPDISQRCSLFPSYCWNGGYKDSSKRLKRSAESDTVANSDSVILYVIFAWSWIVHNKERDV